MPSPKPVFKLIRTLKVILCIALFVLFPSASLVYAADNSVGTIIGISGTIEYRSAIGEPVAEAKSGGVQRVSFGKWENAQFRQPVYAKDIFRTSRKSRLKILLADKSLIALGPNSEMKVESYLYNRKEKLRQGVIGLVHGFSMYIVNKSQTNKKSSFKMVTPTANIAARGTHGYVAFSPKNTFTANKVGSVLTSNVLPGIPEIVELGPLMGNNVPANGPPTPAKPLSPDTMKHIGNIVMGLVSSGSGGGQGGGDPLIYVQGSEDGGGEGGQNTEFSEGFFNPENNPFPDAIGEENFMTTCNN